MSRIVLTLVAACETPAKRPPVKRDAAPTDAAAMHVADASTRKLFITGAGRCGECHEKMFDEWEVSAHATAMTSALYKASVADAKDATCDRCHAPLAALAPHEAVVAEGVTCDVCHTLREPQPSRDGGSFRLAVDDMVKYGPRCDLKDHYFHRMGCSKEHRDAAICGTCHWWEPKGLPVFTEYADWKAGPQATHVCQSCHMPTTRAVIATGSPVRDQVPHHGLLGFANELRARALGLEVRIEHGAAGLAALVTLRNVNAGHAVPAGLPEHRVIVRVRLLDASGGEVASATRMLGRALVDGSGVEAPFWRAVRVGSDTRIAPGGQWHDTFELPAASSGTLEVTVVYRSVSDAIAKQLAFDDVEEVPMTGAKLAFGKLPQTMTVKPVPAGRPGKRPTKAAK